MMDTAKTPTAAAAAATGAVDGFSNTSSKLAAVLRFMADLRDAAAAV